ncbi:MAG: peptidoglycan DD-metalloendopeptidase family protein [Saprospiraceae bacterium]|nr:peptidoglycan DD-metalloendopeptidase family protein [Saprospiraceae bacterium]
MHNNYTNKFFLIALALILFTFWLVAQNDAINASPPVESGPKLDARTVSLGNQANSGEEHLYYSNGEQKMRFDPREKEAVELPNSFGNVDFTDKLFKSNLGEPEQISERIEKIGGQTYTFITERRTGSNGNVITITIGESPIISISGLKEFVLKNEKSGFRSGSNELKRNPISWLDQTHLLISKGEIDAPFGGIFILDLKTGKEEKVLDTGTYFEFYISPSGRYLAFTRPKYGYPSTENPGSTSILIYDFRTKLFKILADPGGIIGWTTKQITQNPAAAGFSIGAGCDPYKCMLLTSLNYKLPFKCGEAYRVSRDGTCNTPQECGYTAGLYPKASWVSTSSGHTGARAIDFSDFNVGGTNEDHLPVLASANGIIWAAGWQDINYKGCVNEAGAGLRVWIKHADGTYTMYGHLSQITVSVGQNVAQGQQVGLEGHTGHCIPCDAEHIHFERRTDPGSGKTSVWTQFSELNSNQAPTSNYIYISKNGNCSMNCSNVTTIPSCGVTLSSQSTVNLFNSRSTYFVTMSGVTGNNAATVNETGPEKIYQITTVKAGLIKVDLSNVSYSKGNKLNIFILSSPGSCSILDPLLHCKASSYSSSLTYDAPVGSYFIVIDGVNGSSGTYTITVSAPCVGSPNLTDAGSSRNPSGRNINITAKIKNTGNANAGAFFTTRFYLSNDIYLGNDYTLVDLNYNMTLLPNGTHSYNFNWTIPNNIPGGTYYLLETIDYGNKISESNENDNSFYFAGSFYVPPTLSGTLVERTNRVESIDAMNEYNNNSIEEIIYEVFPTYNMIKIFNTCEAIINGLYIDVNNLNSNANYMIYNSFGQCIKNSYINDGLIHCEVPCPGIYFITITNPDGKICVQKIFIK